MVIQFIFAVLTRPQGTIAHKHGTDLGSIGLFLLLQCRFCMPAKDTYHNTVKKALIKDGWTITHDPLTLKWGAKDMFVDLGAQQLLAAEKELNKIAVEIKSFVGRSDMEDLEKALGQYTLYYDVLAEREPDRVLYVAVPQEILKEIFEEPIGKLLLKNKRLRLIIFEPDQEVISQWIT